MTVRKITSAKINIGLYVFGVRNDGFHNIQSLFYPVNQDNSNLFGDIIDVEEGCFCGAGKVRLLQSGLTIPGSISSNISLKAYNILDEKFSLPPVQIHLEKNVPIGAGLGGGSADGVYTLMALNELFRLNLSQSDLFYFSLKLGSDCPFFTENVPTVVEGRGEVLRPVGEIDALKDCRIEIVPSDIFISTPHAYSIVRERDNEQINKIPSISELIKYPISHWQDLLVNDFETPVFNEYPQLKEIKEDLISRGAIYASMTGSGSAIYGIFSK